MESSLSGQPARFQGGLHEVAEGVFAWLQPNGGWGESNAGLVVGEDVGLLVDTLWDPDLTREMLAAMVRRAPVPIRTLVNTHSDGDHVWGNQVLAGIEIVSTQAAAELIRDEPPGGLVRFQALAPRLRRWGKLPLAVIGPGKAPGLPALRPGELGGYMEDMLRPFHFSAVRVVAPTREFSGELTLEVGGRQVDLIEVGPAHTPGDLIVHVPDADTVFAADVMFVGVAPVMWAGPTENWIRALDRISQLAPRAVVPGHGPIASLDEVALLRDYLIWVQAEAEARLAGGESVYDTSRALVFSDEYRSSSWCDWEGPERIVVTVATIDRHRRGAPGPVSDVQRAQIFGGVAHLAGELQRPSG